jgi:hypothetical protein
MGRNLANRERIKKKHTNKEPEKSCLHLHAPLNEDFLNIIL